jgi:methylated-DNA-[protein]-cysteine S-methyltransferase
MISIDLNPVYFCKQEMRFGQIVALWSRYRGNKLKINRIILSIPGISAPRTMRKVYPNVQPASCSEITTIVNKIRDFLYGENIRFSLDIIRLDICSSFQQQVLRAEYAIPRGRVSTYGLIAKHLGKPTSARAVGTALATNPFPIIIPCHRAIRSDGSLGGFQGGLNMKRALLEMEGIAFRDANHVAIQEFYY